VRYSQRRIVQGRAVAGGCGAHAEPREPFTVWQKLVLAACGAYVAIALPYLSAGDKHGGHRSWLRELLAGGETAGVFLVVLPALVWGCIAVLSRAEPGRHRATPDAVQCGEPDPWPGMAAAARDCQVACDRDCEIAMVHCAYWHEPRHRPGWHDPGVCDREVDGGR
jgi:hypothetical protein